MRRFWERLEAFGDRVALVDEGGKRLTYAVLAAAADAFCQRSEFSGRSRPLLAIECRNDIESIIAYVGALRAGWPVLLLSEEAVRKDTRIVDAFRPNFFYKANGARHEIEIGDTDDHPLHPDLAVLLPTSGTTGAPKLVRLSKDNIAANASAIAEYLGLTDADRAITTLSFHYSYGMSVINSYLDRGARLILTDRSVVEPEFWDFFDAAKATSIALVPIQFDLLDRVGFADRQKPSLRYVTQAGGRLAKPAIERYAALGAAQGWNLFVMYGQTEASPRMAYVPPEEIAAWPDSIGRPIPGGEFELRDEDDRVIEGVMQAGELVYRGPNVMLGYATALPELSEGPQIEALRTGDMAERLENGFYRIVGRRSRFVKIYGFRIGLDDVEKSLAEQGVVAWCVNKDDQLAVMVSREADVAKARTFLIERYDLPSSSINLMASDAPPLLPSGKVDYRMLASAFADNKRNEPSFAEALKYVLRAEAVDPALRFVDCKIDSLSFVEIHVALSERLGAPPPDWEQMPFGELIALADGAAKKEAGFRLRFLDVPVDVVGRVVAFSLIITLHATNFHVGGSSMLITFLVGYSLARFQWPSLQRGETGKVLQGQLGEPLLWYYTIMILLVILGRDVSWLWFLLVGNFEPYGIAKGWTPYWFISLYVQLYLFAAAAFSLERCRRAVARSPIAYGFGLFALSALAVYALDVFQLRPGLMLGRLPVEGLMLASAGWLAFFAGADLRSRVLASAAIGVASFLVRDAAPLAWQCLVLGGLALVWARVLPMPRAIGKGVIMIGRQALMMYILHPVVISLLQPAASIPEMAWLAIVLVGSFVLAIGLRFSIDYLMMNHVAMRRT